jgi:putative FmdB family regulatory protein
MPIYEYRCETCGTEFEALQKMDDPIPQRREGCPHEGCQIMKKLSPFSSHILGQRQPPDSPVDISPAKAFTPLTPDNDPVHICSKYCSHHTIGRNLP